jgi:hypothetical protein
VPVDPPQYPADRWPVVPVAGNHAIPDGTHGTSRPSTPGRIEFVLSFGGSPLEEAGAAEADGHLGMRAQPDKVALTELGAAAPARRRGRLNRFRSGSHVAIMRLVRAIQLPADLCRQSG